MIPLDLAAGVDKSPLFHHVLYMKKNILSYGFLLVLLFSVSAQATLIVNDTFDVGAAPSLGDDVDDPNDVAWTGQGGSNMSIDGGNFSPPNSLKNQGGNQYRYQLGALPGAPLSLSNTGDNLTLTTRFRTNNAGALPANATTDGHRFGFFNGSTGYALDIGVGGTNSFRIARDIGGATPMGNDVQTEFLADLATGAPSINDGLWHLFSLSLTRTTTGLAVTADYDSGAASLSFTDNSPVTTDFSDIFMGLGAHSIDYFADDVMVNYSTAIPEPAAGMLFVLGGLALCSVRRRRAQMS
jgi:hypothetical protein